MATHVHLFNPGESVTFTAGAAITGGQLLFVSGNRTLSPTTASTPAWYGTAAFDAAVGEKVTALRGGVQRIVASGAIAAGDRVIPAAAGKVATLGAGDASHAVGIALTGGTNVAVEIALSR